MRKYIIVTKEDSVMVAEQLRPSCKMFLEGASYVAMSGGNMVGKMPRVMSYKNIGIGYEAEMDEMALQMVREASLYVVNTVEHLYEGHIGTN